MSARRRLLFATTSAGKLRELRALVADLPLEVVGPAEVAGGLPTVEETGETFAENARLKALACARATGMLCLADDSGLAVDALDGAPGVRSARYAEGSDRDRYLKLLRALESVADEERTAAFHCALCLASPLGVVAESEGTCPGTILREPQGSEGFGYDPVFHVRELGRAMAELTVEEKQAVSHRGRAFAALRSALALAARQE